MRRLNDDVSVKLYFPRPCLFVVSIFHTIFVMVLQIRKDPDIQYRYKCVKFLPIQLVDSVMSRVELSVMTLKPAFCCIK